MLWHPTDVEVFFPTPRTGVVLHVSDANVHESMVVVRDSVGEFFKRSGDNSKFVSKVVPEVLRAA